MRFIFIYLFILVILCVNVIYGTQNKKINNGLAFKIFSSILLVLLHRLHICREKGIHLFFCPPTSCSWRMGCWTCALIRERQLANQALIHRPRVSPNLLLWQDNEGTLMQLQTQPILLSNYWKKKKKKSEDCKKAIFKKINGHLLHCQILITTINPCNSSYLCKTIFTYFNFPKLWYK